MMATVSERRRQQRGWYFYDWANSAFSTTVVTVFLGPYITTVTQRAADSTGYVHPLGVPVRAESFFPYVVSLSVALQVLLLPLAGAVADRSQRKHELLAASAYLGALVTMTLYFVRGTGYLLGGALFVVANMAFGVSVVIYNAFLPEIAEPVERDRVSSRGWALGYLGGGLLLLADLVLFLAHDRFGVGADDAVRLSLCSAGAWWALFTVIPLRALPRGAPRAGTPGGAGALSGGFAQLARTVRESRAYPQTLLFLAAYLLYNDGVQTVIALASTYGAQELHLTQTVLIGAILLVQFVACGGAVLLGWLARFLPTRTVVLASLVVWTLTVAASYELPARRPAAFYGLAVAIGIVLGGSQALSRSLFSHLIPRGREAEYFSLYEVSERGTSWLGTLLFGLSLQWSGSYRTAILSLVVFFVAGFVLLTRVDVHRGVLDAGNVAPPRL